MPPGKVSEFYRQDSDWFCKAGLPSDIMVVVNDVNFHLHRFPLISKCGKFAKMLEESQPTKERKFSIVALEEFPGGPDTFLLVSKFCYSVRIDFTPRNVVSLYCAAEFLEMTNEYGEHNLLSKSESFFHKTVLRSWKNCIMALKSCETLMSNSERLQIVSKSVNSLSMMACTDRSLFGWPMMMYGTFQSPGGGILWNGINTGTRICGSENDWWFEDISYLNVVLFEKLIKTMQIRAMRPEKIAGAIMFYCRKYLPGLGRWDEGRRKRTGSVLLSFSFKPAVNQRILLETIVKILPEKKSKSFCRFLLGLLRVALILGVNHNCTTILEGKIGIQLEYSTIDGLLIPNYCDSDALYNTVSVERMIRCFLFSNPSTRERNDVSSPLKSVGKLIDSYITEIASDVNLKVEEFRSLANALPESSRTSHDGLYRSLDVFLKAHPGLSEEEKEHLFNIIDYNKLSMEACAHASQNNRLPLRIVLRALFFEQLHARSAIVGPGGGRSLRSRGWARVARENRGLRSDMERMGSRVGELEEEVRKMRREVKRASKSRDGSPRWRMGCDLGRPRSSCRSEENAPRPSIEHSSGRSRERRASFFI